MKKLIKNNDCCVDFNDLLKEHIKTPADKKRYKLAGKKIELEDHFNNLLQTMGHKNWFVEIINADAYDYKK
jgi:hypothetical protein